MSDRETTEFTTENGHDVVMYSYATGREFEEIQSEMFKGMKLGMQSGGQPNIEDLDMSQQTKANHKAIELLVQSVDGDDEDVVDTVRDLPYQDYQEVVDKINELTGKKNPTASDDQ